MQKQNRNTAVEDSWNVMTQTFHSQFSAWLKMSADYLDYMNDFRKKMFQDIENPYSLEDETLNADTIEGDWKQLMGDIQKHWGKLTNDNLSQINGSRKELVGALQKNYGMAHKEAEKQMKDWEKTRAKMVKTATN